MNRVRQEWSITIVTLWSFFANVAQAATTPAKPTEVVIIATQHFLTDMPEGYTPAHLRALLNKTKPDVLAVEAYANVPDPWAAAPYELTNITRPWAIEHKVDAIPIGWNEPTYGEQIGAMLRQFYATGHGPAYQKLERQFQQKIARVSTTCAQMNSPTASDAWRGYHAELHKLNGGDTPWEAWNAKIDHQLLAVCHKYSGKRLAVVFGGAHAYYFADYLARQEGVAVLAVEKFFPLTEKEIQTATKDADYVQAMRLLNYPPGSLSTAQLIQIEKGLERLQSLTKYQNDFIYFRAKLLLHQQKPDEALKLFSTLATKKPDTTLAFDGTPLSEAARLQIHFALMQQGKAELARERLRELSADENVSPPIRKTAEALLNATAPK